MVRQLLTVTRLESGALHPRSEVVALGPRVRRAWEALAASGRRASRVDDAVGGLAGDRRRRPARPGPLGAARQRGEVRRAIADHASRSVAERRPERLRLTIADGGPGVAEADRARLFGRFERGAERTADEGSGLGLYVSRELCRAMDGDLVLEPTVAGRGAAFSVYLPGEPPDES